MDHPSEESITEDQETPQRRSLNMATADPVMIGRYRIVRALGQGGFGRVYLARDDDLDRLVAIKVPNPERVAAFGDVESYLAEARALARLDHPRIVPVYDMGRTVDGLCFVVSKFIEGNDLAERLRELRPSIREAVEMVSVVAGALHHAHTRGLVHRDIKPANILIDSTGTPWVADFGLALKDEDFGKGSRLAGTPSYMSPEQARGEGHRVDGRSDLFSLGVVLYELLSGRRPFRGDSREEIMEQIATGEPRPLRQIDDGIPRELERICQKALAKRASERYSTGRDLAEDLAHFLETESPPTVRSAPSTAVAPSDSRGPESSATPITPVRSDSDPRPIKIVPKGLRSFDRHDADFFLELLPGPRDRDGLPEGLRFWKTRIESTDADSTFKVGLLYGPSGCGKSSLVKAGLLPRLPSNVVAVYVESTPEETESRLLKSLRKACPDLASGGDTVDAIAALRRGRVLRPGEKVLIVLDQFEQWLFAHKSEDHPELVAALRQCDGEHVQALVMVRDDFWMAATRFMRDLEIRLVEGENSAAVDLFNLPHARRVLTAFGRSYGILPEKTADVTAEQKDFVVQSVAGLALDGKVISVRLALYAEMVKGKPWTPATLRDIGGARGVGVTFLEETFSASTAPPEHRLHQRAAQSILKALLPATGTDIKGQMRSEAELRELSGYAARPRDFADVINILDSELRLITPTDPEGSDDETRASLPAGDRYYQLTHDYLVHSLRDWLSRKQRETRRGRAELRLAEGAAAWNTRPDNRYLPGIFEWLGIWIFTRAANWTQSEQRMMQQARLVHGVRFLFAIVIVNVLVLAGIRARRWVVENESIRAQAASSAVRGILGGETTAVAKAIHEIPPDSRRWTDPELRSALDKPWSDRKTKLHASLALLPVDSSQVNFLASRLRDASPDELAVILDCLAPHAAKLAPDLAKDLTASNPDDRRILALAGSLARFDPENATWAEQAARVADALTRLDETAITLLRPEFRRVRTKLNPRLAQVFQDKARPPSERAVATTLLADYLDDDPTLLAELLVVAEPTQFLKLFPIAKALEPGITKILKGELEKSVVAAWNDPPPDHSWSAIDDSIKKQFDSALGLIEPTFAFCQTMPLDVCGNLRERLEKSGYRLFRFRPIRDGDRVKVAAVWTRDHIRSELEIDLSAQELTRLDKLHRERKWIPADVAGYVQTDSSGKPADRFAAIWIESATETPVSMFVALDRRATVMRVDQSAAEGLEPLTTHSFTGADGIPRYSGIWAARAANEPARELALDLFESDFRRIRQIRADSIVSDIAITELSREPTVAELAREELERTEKALIFQPDDGAARLARANAFLRLRDDPKALEDLRIAVTRDAQAVPARRRLAVVLARLGRKDEAAAELEKMKSGGAPELSIRFAAAVIAAELGDDPTPALESFAAVVRGSPAAFAVDLDAARSFALAGHAVSKHDMTKARELFAKSLDYLRDAVRQPDRELEQIDNDAALDFVRGEPDFTAIMKPFHPERRLGAVSSADENYTCEISVAIDPAAQLERARELIGRGYRPIAWAITGTSSATASVWRRPSISEKDKDVLAARQARAAIALIRLDKADAIWPLLKHRPDPRLRSFIVNWLRPLGADPAALANELHRITAGGSITPSPETAAEPAGTASTFSQPSPMSSILFHPETSVRRALIMALGLDSINRMPTEEHGRLLSDLLALHGDDPDAGIHSAVEWTLRQWGKSDMLEKSAALKFDNAKRGNRRWFVNRDGLAFSVVAGPVEFTSGSPPTEPDRNSDYERQRRIVIPRSFAISTSEISVTQFRRFLQEIQKPRLNAGSIANFSPDPNGPWLSANWYMATRYCNWLSEREGLPSDQLCYRPNSAGAYAEGMTIPANVLERTGYRLPTEAEWEFACRAGAITARYFGNSAELLPNYERFYDDSSGHAWPAGSRLPNDLGLFDMLGNAYEWCQDSTRDRRNERAGVWSDTISLAETIRIDRKGMLRGGSYDNDATVARSAYRTSELGSYDSLSNGFRIVRTLER